jgi:hypothetical protein
LTYNPVFHIFDSRKREFPSFKEIACGEVLKKDRVMIKLIKEARMRRPIFVLSLLLIVCGLSMGVTTTLAQTYPNRTIQIIIGQPPGAAGDITCRPFAEELGKILGVPVIVINKPGASATLGIDAVVRSKKDGYTIAYTNIQNVYARVAS